MAIQYDVAPGSVLLCDYATGFREPEMVKRRPALVVSPRLRGRKGLCTVVPLSTTPARRVDHQCGVTLSRPPPAPFIALELWAKADMIATVGFSRLDLFRGPRGPDSRRQYLRIAVSSADLAAVRACIRLALGL